MSLKPNSGSVPAVTALILGLSLMAAPGVHGQGIPIKTVPVAAGDQFLLFPSDNLAMGGVRLAMDDTLADPFINPATGSRIREDLFFASPTYYGVSDRNGSGKAFPVGVLFPGETWFGGVAAAIQELKGADRNQGFWPWGWEGDALWIWGPPPPQTLSEVSSRNLYGQAYLGYRFPDRGLSVAVSGSYADLGAVDGVELLYAMAQEIRQSGHTSGLRVGVLKEWEDDRSLELILLNEKIRMTHEVSYLDVFWVPVPGEDWEVPTFETRTEENLDHTDMWGAHLAYRRPLNARGWSVGWSLTTNRLDHPKIPNYEIQNIPRDPGDSWAHALGMGIASTEGPVRFAAEISLEPIWSNTWADAARDTTSVYDTPIQAGEKTIENEFLFTNASLRAGASWDYRKATFRLGLQLNSIDYELEQFDNIQETRRTQDEGWMEWSPSLGVSLKLAGTTIQYLGRLTTGSGRPGTAWSDEVMGTFDALSSFIVAPSGPLTLQDAMVSTHQLSVVIPMR